MLSATTIILLAALAQSTAPKPAVISLQALTVSAPTVTPATITFTASNPDVTPTVSGSAVARVQWTLSNGTSNWTLQVSAPASFSACSTLPASAITASAACTTITGTCTTGSTTLSTSPTTILSGRKTGGGATQVSNVTFTLADGWNHIASSSCQLVVTYTITG